MGGVESVESEEKASEESEEKQDLAYVNKVLASRDSELSTLREKLAHLQLDFEKKIAAMKPAVDAVCLFASCKCHFFFCSRHLNQTKQKFCITEQKADSVLKPAILVPDV
jgi:hypothetical protein